MESEFNPSTEQKKYQPLFDLVADKSNWKNRISAVVTKASLEALGDTTEDLEKAIIFYTGSVPTIEEVQNVPEYYVSAAGYYAAVGA